MRNRIFAVIDPDADPTSHRSRLARNYNRIMVAIIALSMLPLAFKGQHLPLQLIDSACTIVFIADYLARWCVADRLLQRGRKSFLLYPFTPMAILDLASILPGLLPMLNPGLRLFRLARFARALRFIRFLRYSRGFVTLKRVVQREGHLLLSVAALALGYVLVCALVIFNIEPDTFDTFFDAVYWACVSLTTVGYGDIYPTSTAGRIVTIISSFVGIAIVALPAGITASGYLEELRQSRENKD